MDVQLEERMPLSIVTKQNESVSIVLQMLGREILKKFPAVLRQQMENELYGTDCC